MKVCLSRRDTESFVMYRLVVVAGVALDSVSSLESITAVAEGKVITT